MWIGFAVSDCVVQTVPRWMPGYPGPTGPHPAPYRLITVAASIEECKPWFHDLRGETRVRLGRSLC